jgi:Zn finger protein HypA/HybF involved in hydrogenase expression
MRDECALYFDSSIGAIYGAKLRGEFVSRPPKRFDLNAALTENSSSSRKRVKQQLIRDGLLENKCSKCNCLPEWDGNPLVLILDHTNGINNDNRPENLRLLCPNCNSQTATFCRGAFKKRKSVSTEALIDALRASSSGKEALKLLNMDLTGNNYTRITRLKALYINTPIGELHGWPRDTGNY